MAISCQLACYLYRHYSKRPIYYCPIANLATVVNLYSGLPFLLASFSLACFDSDPYQGPLASQSRSPGCLSYLVACSHILLNSHRPSLSQLREDLKVSRLSDFDPRHTLPPRLCIKFIRIVTANKYFYILNTLVLNWYM